MATLSAATSPVFAHPGATGSTRIDWDSGSPNFRVQIFERRDMAGVWSRRPLIGPEVNGHFTISLRPGGIYEAVMFAADVEIDPNEPRTEAMQLAGLRVFALLPDQSNLVSDGANPDQQDVGGTYYARKIATGGVQTFATLEIGKDAPFINSRGFLQVPSPLAVLGDMAEAPARIHDFHATPLDPGNLYHCVVRVHDLTGAWQQLAYSFTTKRREVKLQWETLHINDDGVDVGTGFGVFQVTPSEGARLLDDPLGDIWWYRTRFTTGQTFNLLSQGIWTHTGLQMVREENRKITLFLRGISFRSYPRKNDISTSPLRIPQVLALPFGRRKETVEDLPFSFATQRRDDGLTGSFHFTIGVRVTVTYQP